jgi:hypothetical protein
VLEYRTGFSERVQLSTTQPTEFQVEIDLLSRHEIQLTPKVGDQFATHCVTSHLLGPATMASDARHDNVSRSIRRADSSTPLLYTGAVQLLVSAMEIRGGPAAFVPDTLRG